MVSFDLAVGLRMIRRGQDMPNPLRFQILTKRPGDKGRPPISNKFGSLCRRSLVDSRILTDHLNDVGKIVSVHGFLESPGQDPSAKIIQNENEVKPSPVLHE